MTTPRLRDERALDAALAAERYLLFKHSPRCGISSHAFREYREFAAARPDVATGWIDVVADRALSLEVARRTDVAHASPQVLVLARGQALWDASHHAITRRALDENVTPSTEPGTGGPD